MLNEFGILTNFAENARVIAAMEMRIVAITNMPLTAVRDAIQVKSLAESGNLYAAASKWLIELENKKH